MDNQISLFPDILGTEIEETVKKECERTLQYNYENYFDKINNKHEGYGYAAEVFARMDQDVKRVNGTMKTYLTMLATDDGSSPELFMRNMFIYSQEVAKEAITLAAVAKRIMSEVFMLETLPEEAYGTEDESDEEKEEIEYEDTENTGDTEE